MVVYLDRDRLSKAVDEGKIDVYRSRNGYVVFPNHVPQFFLSRVYDRSLDLPIWSQRAFETHPDCIQFLLDQESKNPCRATSTVTETPEEFFDRCVEAGRATSRRPGDDAEADRATSRPIAEGVNLEQGEDITDETWVNIMQDIKQRPKVQLHCAGRS